MGLGSDRLDFLLRVISAVILIQAAVFKLGSSEESIAMFSALGAEPWGRYLVGALEVLASVLLFVPRWIWLGAGLMVVLMAGAILSHLLRLGVSFNGDGGFMFVMAVIVFINASIALNRRKNEIRILKR